MKLCIIYNFAQHYRTSIFTLIDKVFDCDWVFGDSMGDVKKMDYSYLTGKVVETHTKYLFSGWYWQPKVVSRLFKDYDSYILLGETRAVSTWLFLLLSKLFPSKKVYLWSHGWYGKETRLERLIKKIEFKLPNSGIFLYGNYARELMIKEGFNSDKLFVIHNSLAYDEQALLRQSLTTSNIYQEHFGNDNPNLIFVGRLTKVKQLDLILKAINISKQKGHEYNITYIGGGEMAETLNGLAQSLHLQNNVWLYGPCYDEKTLAKMIYNADLCVAPGNVGLTAMHSMVFGTPVITHNDFPHQMPEFEAIHEGETGCFFERNNIEDLSAKINEWFDSKSNNREIVRQACFKEIDEQWNPHFQLNVLKEHIK